MDSTINEVAEKFTITGNWDEQSKNLKRRFSELTDADLVFEKGEENDLVNRLVAKLNRESNEIKSILRKGHVSLK
ncbi:MAG: hypothetical protein RLO81_04530 [Fulvivirga sp.]|uniref:hypothetical protein n=1 Tax=Fulvivirga sp. TaxID=1931237 RepID=UPI0032F0004B